MSNSLNKQLKGAGSPVFEMLALKNEAGNEIDLFPMLIGLTIYEDMYSPTLSGNIVIRDSMSLFENLPLIGDEDLTIKVKSWNYSDSKNNSLDYLHRTFKIIKITDIVNINDYTKVYTLHFCSPELLYSNSFKLSKGFYNVRNSEIVKNIFLGDYNDENPQGLGFPDNTNNNNNQQINKTYSKYISNSDIEAIYKKEDENDSIFLFIEKTKYTEPVISFTYKNPFSIINEIAEKSIRSSPGILNKDDNIVKNNPSANFLFFENKRGYNFISLDTLYENKENIKTNFQYGNGVQNTNSKISNNRQNITETILAMEIQNCYDIINQIDSGMYTSKFVSYDLMTGKQKTYNYSYIDDFKNQQNTEEDGFPFIRDSSSLHKRHMSKIIYNIESPSSSINNYISTYTERNNSGKIKPGKSEYLQSRISQLSKLSNYRLLFKISGNSKHKVGDIVKMDLRSIKYFENMNELKEEPNKYYSGNYLITSIKHSFTKFEYLMDIEATKDSLSTKL